MIKNFFTLMYRHLSKSILNAFIGFFGMIFGLTAFLFILLWVTNELKFDQFNTDKEYIYRLELSDKSSQNRVMLPSIVAPLLKDNVPEIKNSIRLRILNSSQFVKNISDPDQDFIDAGRHTYASNDFFKTFSFQFLTGDSENALLKKGDVVITESLAKTIFGKIDVVGETISGNYNVTGVIKDEPNFHIPFKMVTSFISLEDGFKDLGYKTVDTWFFQYMPTYLKVSNNKNIKALEEKIASVLNQHRPDKVKEKNGEYTCYLRPLDDIYFKGGEAKEEGYAIHGNLKKVMAYISIVVLILVLVCINFINLNTSNYLTRVKEVGIKKISGATKKSLFFQFLGETMVMILLSFIAALIIVYRFLPNFNYLMYSDLKINSLFTPINLIAIFIGLVVVSLFSGGLPSLYITSFNPIQILKGMLKDNSKKFKFTKVNLVVQFAMTTILLIITLTVYYQIDYMRGSDLGFVKEHKIYFPFDGRNPQKLNQLKTSLLSNPNILSVSSTFYGTPAVSSSSDREKSKLEFNGNEYEANWVWADEDYLDVLDLTLLEGEFFNKRNGFSFVHKSGKISTTFSQDKSDPINEFISDIVLNETAVKLMNLEAPLESFIKMGARKCKVIGVVKDFHLSSLDNRVTPLYFMKRGGYEAIAKISSHNIPETLEFLRQKVKESTGADLLNIKFLDEEFDKLYRKDESFSKLLGYATLFTILIACMGLLGMVSQTITLRIKEVGIRKSLGSSTSEILMLFIKPIILLIMISTLIAIPVAWYISDDWLSDYPYNTGVNWWFFLFAFVFMLITTFSTVVWQCLKASAINPVELLRDE